MIHTVTNSASYAIRISKLTGNPEVFLTFCYQCHRKLAFYAEFVNKEPLNELFGVKQTPVGWFSRLFPSAQLKRV